MLHQEFDISIADFSSIEYVDVQELEQADIIHIRGHVQGGIYHSSKMMWHGDITDIQDPLDFIRSKRERLAYPKSLESFQQLGFDIRTEPLTDERKKEFWSLYQETTMKKDRVIQYNFDGLIESRKVLGAQYFVSGLFDAQGIFHSGLLFSISKKTATVSFGAKKRFQEIRGGVGGVCEYELIKFCKQNGVEEITHGLGRNPVGIFTSVGVFEFKARYGFTAFPNEYWRTTFIRNPKIALSDLLFISLDNNQICYVIVSDANEDEVKKKYATKEVPTVKVLPFSALKDQYDSFLKTLVQ